MDKTLSTGDITAVIITPRKGRKVEILILIAGSSMPKYAECFVLNTHQFSGTAQNTIRQSRSYMLLQSI